MKKMLQLTLSFVCGAMFVFFFGKSAINRTFGLVGNESPRPCEPAVGNQPNKEAYQQAPAQKYQAVDVQKILSRMDQNRKELLSNLLPSEILAWEKLREDKVENFLRTTEKFWHNGPGDIQSRFDRTLAGSCLGEYEGRIEYQTSDMREPASYDLALNLSSLAPQEKGNKIALNSDKFGSFSANFSTDFLGTDSKSNSLSVLWHNFNNSQSSSASHFVFYMRPNIQIGETINEDFFGLDEKLKFQRIGSVVLKKIR